MGKDNDLLNVNIKNVDTLSKDLVPQGLGMRTMHLFLEQVNDISAYHRHQRSRSTEGVGEQVEAFISMNTYSQEQKCGLTDMD